MKTLKKENIMSLTEQQYDGKLFYENGSSPIEVEAMQKESTVESDVEYVNLIKSVYRGE